MSASVEAEAALSKFIASCENDPSSVQSLQTISDLDQLRRFVVSVDPSITGLALIPLDQATRKPKITVDSGHLQDAIPWRLLRCPGGPLVLQMICKSANFALWIESC
ncbi:MAG: hypothetical protein CBB80_000390 [Synechococcus sp. TMED20]|jgi:hypothetical protein|nr:MAG: hypothetical protein CBB80_000390 [Synechococcus sp. TMED20]